MHQNLVGRLNPNDANFNLDDFYPGRWHGPPRGPWFTAASGTKVHLLDPQHDELLMADMAHGLAAIPRFGGHVGVTLRGAILCRPTILYTVAQHSVLVLWLTFRLHEQAALQRHCFGADAVTPNPHTEDAWGDPKNLALLEHAVLHDSPEAWLGDKISPLKQLFPFFKVIENNLFACIADKRRLPPLSDATRATIKAADRIALSIERALYCPNPPARDDIVNEENVELPGFAHNFIQDARRARFYGRDGVWPFDLARIRLLDTVHQIAGRRWSLEAADDPDDELPGRLELPGVPDFDQSMSEYMNDIREMLLS